MKPQAHVLADSAAAVVSEGEEYGPDAKSRGKTPWRVRSRVCRGGRSDGVQIVEFDNGRIAIDVLPTRGMGVWRVRRGAQTLGWRSPVRGPVNPAFVPTFDPSGLGWLEGFDELMCRCGLSSNGAPDFDASGRLTHPLHGRIANLPADRVELYVDEDAGQLTLRGVVEETRFHFHSLRLTSSITTRFGSNEFSWTDEVENIGGRDATMQMLYHFNVGQPLLVPGARLTAPVAAAAPISAAAADGNNQWHTMPEARPGSTEQVFCFELHGDDRGNTRVLLSELAGGEAVSLRFNTNSLSRFVVWKNFPAEADGYVMGLEPSTNYPNPHSFEKTQGRVISLAQGEKWRTEVAVVWHTEADAIASEVAAIRAIQGDRETIVHDHPRSDWSACA